jgi:5-methylcytosine-specific restriction endonuclease McrA
MIAVERAGKSGLYYFPVFRNSAARSSCGAVAEEVDHIIPVALAPERQFDMTNARASCRRCNAKRSKRVV